MSLLTGRQKVSELKQGVLTPLFHRSFLCKWMPDSVKEKSKPPSLVAEGHLNKSYKEDEVQSCDM